MKHSKLLHITYQYYYIITVSFLGNKQSKVSTKVSWVTGDQPCQDDIFIGNFSRKFPTLETVFIMYNQHVINIVSYCVCGKYHSAQANGYMSTTRTGSDRPMQPP